MKEKVFVMKEINPRSAGIFSAILALVLLLCIYTMLGTVDVVFMQGEREVFHLVDVGIFSPIDAPETDEVYVYNTDGGEKEFADNFDFRFEIGKTVVLNLLTFKWQENDNVIELHAK